MAQAGDSRLIIVDVAAEELPARVQVTHEQYGSRLVKHVTTQESWFMVKRIQQEGARSVETPHQEVDHPEYPFDGLLMLKRLGAIEMLRERRSREQRVASPRGLGSACHSARKASVSARRLDTDTGSAVASPGRPRPTSDEPPEPGVPFVVRKQDFEYRSAFPVPKNLSDHHPVGVLTRTWALPRCIACHANVDVIHVRRLPNQ